jgi:multidrug efflux pump subunit AcrA (membrane-fusion protein)
MLDALLCFSLAHRVLVLVVAGGWAFRRLKRQAYPDISDPSVVVIIPYPGFAAEGVEQQVTIPIERERRQVTLGPPLGNSVPMLEGLQAGDRVVVDGAMLLKDR